MSQLSPVRMKMKGGAGKSDVELQLRFAVIALTPEVAQIGVVNTAHRPYGGIIQVVSKPSDDLVC